MLLSASDVTASSMAGVSMSTTPVALPLPLPSSLNSSAAAGAPAPASLPLHPPSVPSQLIGNIQLSDGSLRGVYVTVLDPNNFNFMHYPLRVENFDKATRVFQQFIDNVNPEFEKIKLDSSKKICRATDIGVWSTAISGQIEYHSYPNTKNDWQAFKNALFEQLPLGAPSPYVTPQPPSPRLTPVPLPTGQSSLTGGLATLMNPAASSATASSASASSIGLPPPSITPPPLPLPIPTATATTPIVTVPTAPISMSASALDPNASVSSNGSLDNSISSIYHSAPASIPVTSTASNPVTSASTVTVPTVPISMSASALDPNASVSSNSSSNNSIPLTSHSAPLPSISSTPEPALVPIPVASPPSTTTSMATTSSALSNTGSNTGTITPIMGTLRPQTQPLVSIYLGAPVDHEKLKKLQDDRVRSARMQNAVNQVKFGAPESSAASPTFTAPPTATLNPQAQSLISTNT